MGYQVVTSKIIVIQDQDITVFGSDAGWRARWEDDDGTHEIGPFNSVDDVENAVEDALDPETVPIDYPAVAREIGKLISEFGMSADNINDGQCHLFASRLRDRLEPLGIEADRCATIGAAWCDPDAPSDGAGILYVDEVDVPGIVDGLPGEEVTLNDHTWLEIGGRCFDAETPGGVSHPLLLPFFQRHLARFRKNHDAHTAALVETGFWGTQGAGCVFFARSTGRFLIAHRSEAVLQPGTWGTWGGAMDDGESPYAAVTREVREEAGYMGDFDIAPMYVFESGSFRYSNFLVLVDDEFEPHMNWETQDFRWCQYGDWPSPLHFGLEAVLEDGPSCETMREAVSKCGHEPATPPLTGP